MEMRASGRPIRNNFPIVLVYGFMGYVELPFSGFHHWGGTIDLAEELRKAGYTVYVAPVGPVSSLHDRACELYSFIKGGMVDYGAAHSAAAGHNRWGRDYPGVFPQWGEIDPDSGSPRKVHLICHSMGGQTARVLAHLLGDREWIASIFTISTPHDGTTLTYRYHDPGRMIKLFASLLVLQSDKQDDPVFDMQLEHWKGATEPGETLSAFLERVIKDNAWLETKDFGFYDLTPKGAAEINRETPSLPCIYYFSLATSRTQYDEKRDRWIPAPGMLLPLRSTARSIGSCIPESGKDSLWEGTDAAWRENDGLVNTISMDAPSLSSCDPIRRWSLDRMEVPDAGVWNFLGTLGLDHWQVHLQLPVGGACPEGYDSLLDYYIDICSFLRALPPNP
ncbi:esterase/lipase family protein [Sediminispirochaeta bajacaliforniensis]|uniref:esterase/lipase family protein n=1 Tax=Sediminispirochaeta bajacaliforniensis TaxID=148 RepID=UPI00037EEB6B|nr:hypothetical protein [Sediminispirochaeta bajacaliforniensis]